MGAGPTTAAELIKINDQNLGDSMATELLLGAPVLAALAARESSAALRHSWLIENVPEGAAFRVINDGRTMSHSEDRVADVPLGYLDASFDLDVAAGKGFKDGTDAMLSRRRRRAFRRAFTQEERQLFYGTTPLTTNDADGMPYGQLDTTGGHVGLHDFWGDDTIADKALYAPHVQLVNTGITGAGFRTSVWLLRSVDPEDDIATITGMEGFEEMEPTVTRRAGDVTASSFHGAWWVDIGGYWGFQFGQKRAAYRLANIDSSLAGVGNVEVTDELIGQAISAFPSGFGPNLIAMTRQSQRQLGESRTTTVQSTMGSFAEIPQSSHGIPILTTDNISNNEDEVVKT